MSNKNENQGGERSAYIRVFSLHYLPAFVAIIAMVAIMVYADWQNQSNARQDKRAAVSAELALIRTKLEGSINSNVSLIRGLVGALETEPQMDQARYNAMASRVLLGKTQFINVAAAPNMVVRMVYPLERNKKAIGLDYTKNESQRAGALMARDSRRIVVTGPVKLVQGGEALIARFPVFAVASDGSRNFWGIVSALMDLQALYHDSGLLAVAAATDVAITAVPHGDAVGDLFYGKSDVMSRDPVLVDVQVGHDDWLLAATPKAGWELPMADIWRFRLALLFGEFIIILPMIWAGRLMEERQRNVRTLEQRDDQMKLLSHRLQIALETSKIGIWEYDIAANRLIWDERMKDLYGVAPGKAVATYEDWKNGLHPDDFVEAQREFSKAIETEGEYRSEFRVIAHDGGVRYVRAIGTTYKDSKGRRKIVGVNWDVTEDVRMHADLRSAKRRSDEQNKELEKARMRMESAALHDALTGLPNRRYLDQMMLEMDGAEGLDREPEVTVLHIDLDRFKDINDTLGHAAGDLILRHASATLRQNIRDNDFLARIGGDEFVIISRARAGSEDYTDMAARLVEAISKPIDYQGHECRVGASIGIASSCDGEKIDQLLVNADIALYEAKRRGRNRVEKFSDTLRLVAVNTKKTADEILRGLEQNEFIAYFQPQFDAHSLEIVGIEALARWDHPTKGILAPDSFLKIAESLKVVSTIDDMILTQALLQRYRLEANGIHIPKVSVNISAQRLREETLIERLKSLSFQPGTLSFELLESISFDGHDGEFIPQIEQIKRLGIDIEIDDFGTGYASIVTLLKLTPRRLKIDRQLIAPIIDSPDQQKLVSSIIDIGRSRGIEIVAEGVETMAHAEILRDLGCHILQGYALSRPLCPADLLTFAKERRWLEHASISKAS
ncbi:MAG: sensory box/GGDEF family protein [Rhizobium sp.]|nr:sensory box/GGDEF family protein [Rhizobium sp.]